MKNILTSAMLVFCVACTTTNPIEMRKTADEKHNYLTTKSISDAIKVTDEMIPKCNSIIGFSMVPGAPAAELSRNVSIDGKSANFYIYNPLGILLMIDLESTKQNGTIITAYARNSAWGEKAKNAISWYSSNNPKCE